VAYIPEGYSTLNRSERDQTVQEANSNALSMVEILLGYARDDPFVLAVCSIKGFGALVWGDADLLQVNFSRMDKMHSLGDQSLTLGILYSMVAFGCQLGPLLWNMCTPQQDKVLLSCIVSAYGILFCGYLLLVVAHDI
jgi:hypothetical protein